jgi:hypothetical protein
MPGRFVFCTVEDGALAAEALATFREEEGLSVLLPVARVEALGLPVESPMRQITLRVHSALEGVGLTAAVAGVLADAGIACNMIAARLHDHAFVPEARAEEALALLQALQRDGEGEG